MRNREAEEKIILEAIQSAREIQTFLWGDPNGEWGLEEWKRMLRKRIEKIDQIDPDRPHSIVELRKRLLQNAALSIALLELLNHGMLQTDNKNGLLSNLPEYGERKLDKYDHVYWTPELAEKAMREMANTSVVDVEQMEKIYSPDVFKPFFCEYCRKRVSRDHECEKGVR